MIGVSRDRRTQGLGDEERVNRFVGSMLLLGVLLIVAGAVYAGWFAFGPR